MTRYSLHEKPTIKSERVPLIKTYGVPATQEVGMINESLSKFNPLRKGDIMPAFILPDFNGKEINSSELLNHGLIVISFNRGNLCAFCQMEINTWINKINDINRHFFQSSQSLLDFVQVCKSKYLTLVTINLPNKIYQQLNKEYTFIWDCEFQVFESNIKCEVEK